MYGQFHSGWQIVKRSVAKYTKRTVALTKLSIISTLIISASFIPTIALTGTAHADVSCSPDSVNLSGSSWLSSSGVNVCGADEGSTNVCVPVSGAPYDSTHCSAYSHSGGYVWSGTEWQCVEMVNRLYLTKGWTTTTWIGNGNSIKDDVSNHPGLTKQDDGSVSYLNPGDVITFTYSTDGHAGIINTVGSTIQIVNQNTSDANKYSSAHIASGTSLGASNADLDMTGWAGYDVQAIIHHPSTTTASNRPGALARSSTDMDTFYQSSSGNNLVDLYWNSTNGWASTYWGDSIASAPSAIARTSTTMDVFFRNTGNNLVDRYWNSSTGWNSVALVTNGTMRGNPTVITRDSNHIDVFYRDNSNNLVDENWNSTNGWASTYWGDNLAGDPSAIVRDASDMDIFFRNTGNNLAVRYWNSSTGWNAAALTTNGHDYGDPGALTRTSSDISAFYKDNSNNLVDEYWDSTNGWASTYWGDNISGTPSAISRTSSSMDIFFRNTGNNLVDRYLSSSYGWNTATLESTSNVSTDPSAIDRDSSDMDIFYGNNGNLDDEYWNSSTGWDQTYWSW